MFILAKDTVKSAKETQQRPLLVDYAAWAAKLNKCGGLSQCWIVVGFKKAAMRVLFFISGSKGLSVDVREDR